MGLGATTIRKIEGDRPVSQSTITAIETIIGSPPADVSPPALVRTLPFKRLPEGIGALGEPHPIHKLCRCPKPPPETSFRPIPVINWIHARAPEEAIEQGEVLEWVRPSCGFRLVFALRIRDDSMEPEYREGDYIVVARDATADPEADIVAINRRTREAVLRRLHDRNGQLLLCPLNPEGYQEEPFTEETEIAGRVLWNIRRR